MDNMERRQNEELLEARRLRRQEQKRRLLMRQRVLAVVLLVIVILSLILILRGCRNRREHPELYVKKDSALELQTEPDATVNIAAVGDIMITDDLLADAKQPDGSYTPKMKCSDSASKAIIPGKKMPWRLYDENGQAQCDLIAMDGEVIEAGKPVTMVNLDSDAIERTITFTPTAVRPLLVPHILGGKLAIELPSIAEKKAYIAKQLTEESWESELRLECPHKHYVNMTPAVAECRSRMYAELHGGKV